jgi:hypothetical protein
MLNAALLDQAFKNRIRVRRAGQIVLRFFDNVLNLQGGLDQILIPG